MIEINFVLDSKRNLIGPSNKDTFYLKDGENNSITLVFNVDSSFADLYKYIDIKLDNNAGTVNEIFVGNKGETEFHYNIDYTSMVGQRVIFELVMKDTLEEGPTVIKSIQTIAIPILPSINVSTLIISTYPDVLTQLQTAIDSNATNLSNHLTDLEAHGLSKYLIASLVAGDNVVLEDLGNKTFRISTSGGGSGTMSHNELLDRDLAQQHPTTAIYDAVSGLSQAEINASMIKLDAQTGKINPVYIPVDGKTIIVDTNGELVVDAEQLGIDNLIGTSGTISSTFSGTSGDKNIILGTIDLSLISYVNVSISNIIFHQNVTYVKKTDLFSDFSVASSVVTRITPNFGTTLGNAAGNAIDFNQRINIDSSGNVILTVALPDTSEFKLSTTFTIKYLEV